VKFPYKFKEKSIKKKVRRSDIDLNFSELKQEFSEYMVLVSFSCGKFGYTQV